MAEKTGVKKPRGNPNWSKKSKENGQNISNENSTMTKEEETPTSDVEEGQQDGNGNKSLPKDIFSDEIPDNEVLPLEDEVAKNPYATIPEVSEEQGQESDTSQKQPADKGTTAPTQPTSPTQQPKTEEEIRTQAEMTVDMIFRGYEKLHGVGRWIGKVDENELANLHISGKINMGQEFPLGNRKVTAGQFFAEYNKSIDENITVQEEFKTAIRPPLTRIAIKYKWLISDEIYCALLVSEDLSTKISLLIGLKKSANMVLKACMALMEKQKSKAEKGEVKQANISQTNQENPSESTPKEGDEWKEPD